MSKTRINLGKYGENIAVRYLRQNGFKILEKNFRNRFGEVDIIAQEYDTYVFVEVKTRRSNSFGQPEESVTLRKQNQISRTALGYLSNLDLLDAPARFDIIAVLCADEKPQINHIINAFDIS